MCGLSRALPASSLSLCSPGRSQPPLAAALPPPSCTHPRDHNRSPELLLRPLSARPSPFPSCVLAPCLNHVAPPQMCVLFLRIKLPSYMKPA